MREAALECCGAFTIGDRRPEVWDRLAGIYACGPGGRGGFVRLHTNFQHHRDGVLGLLGLPSGPQTQRLDIGRARRLVGRGVRESRGASRARGRDTA
jgi:hypothetical protein